MLNKYCSKCGIEKHLSDYYKSKKSKDGHESYCKKCRNIQIKKWQKNNIYNIKKYQTKYEEKNIEKRIKQKKQYYLDNKKYIDNKTKEYNKANKDDVSRRQKLYYINNKEKVNNSVKNWRKNNPGKIKKIEKEWRNKNRERINNRVNERYKKNPKYNIHRKIKGRIGAALKSQEASKNYKTIELLGCDFEFYKQYLESLFIPGMTWEKLRAGEIHIDHKIPCSSFDLTKPEEQKACFNWRNTQPLWAVDNLKKGANIAS